MKVEVTSKRSNSIVRKGETKQVEWTPRIQSLVEAGHLTVTSRPVPEETRSKDELVAAAEARGVYVAKSWAKTRIAAALEAAEEAESV